jgi:hypothetical protein
MRVLIVFESMFGNTERIAGAVAEGLAAHADVEVVEVGEAPSDLDDDLDLLVIGAPTHGHGLSRPTSRQTAARQAPTGVVSARIGLREWLDSLPGQRPGPSAAAFDTRIDKPRWLTGSAAKAAAKRLRRSGCTLAAAPESFYVAATAGPLRDGERERAHRWGSMLGTRAVIRSPGP